MRLHPSSAVACRKPTGDAVMPAVGEVGPADVLMIDLLAANKDASRFGQDASEFRPGRETQGSAGPYGLSFGLGAHACIGRNLAAGALPRGGTDPAEHHYGTITLLVLALLRHGARPDPADPARQDASITRVKWARYPVLFNPPQQDGS